MGEIKVKRCCSHLGSRSGLIVQGCSISSVSKAKLNVDISILHQIHIKIIFIHLIILILTGGSNHHLVSVC